MKTKNFKFYFNESAEEGVTCGLLILHLSRLS